MYQGRRIDERSPRLSQGLQNSLRQSKLNLRNDRIATVPFRTGVSIVIES